MDHMDSRHGIEAFRLEFSGHGGEYFRVWIVNVLLSIVTLGLYTPWARRRTARYFYDHTLVAQSPLEFTGSIIRMVKGFLLFLLLYIAYFIASETGQTTAVNLFLVAAVVLTPYVWGSAMRFRLSSTRWRGLHLYFAASWKEVYVASWPFFAIAAIWAAGVYAAQSMLPESFNAEPPPPPTVLFQQLKALMPPLLGIFGLALLLSLLCIIRLEFNYRSLLVLRGGIGTQFGRWKPVYSDFVKIWLATIGVFLLCVIAIAIMLVVVVGGSASLLAGARSQGPVFLIFVFFAIFSAIVALLLASSPALAYREVRMFQLVWSNVGLSSIARFKCDLKTWAFVRLHIKNLLLTLLTLGFYRPFARVSEYRMKIDSLTLHVKGGLDQLVGQLARQQQSGVGDALADAAGLDLIG